MPSLRRIVEYLGRGRYLKRKLPEEFGGTVVYVTPDAALKYLKPGDSAFDTSLLRIVTEFVQPGDVVWDIGANVGCFAFSAATKVGPNGQVLCVEPDVWLANLIRQSANLQQNRALRLRIISAAVSEKCGVSTLLIAARGRASNALEVVGGRSQAGGVRERQLVPTITLNDLLSASVPPDLVKIDVEGAEALVLRGASHLLGEERPLFYCEVGDAQNSLVTGIFHDSSYVLADPTVPAGQRRALKQCPFNVLAVPQESAAKYGLA